MSCISYYWISFMTAGYFNLAKTVGELLVPSVFTVRWVVQREDCSVHWDFLRHARGTAGKSPCAPSKLAAGRQMNSVWSEPTEVQVPAAQATKSLRARHLLLCYQNTFSHVPLGSAPAPLLCQLGARFSLFYSLFLLSSSKGILKSLVLTHLLL